MSTSKILTGGGFTKIPHTLCDQNSPKFKLYHLKETTQEKIARAQLALYKEREKGWNYAGSLDKFGQEIQEKPYLLKEGKTLQLIKGKETQNSDKMVVHLIEVSQTANYQFLKGVNVGQNFNINSQSSTIIIQIPEAPPQYSIPLSIDNTGLQTSTSAFITNITEQDGKIINRGAHVKDQSILGNFSGKGGTSSNANIQMEGNSQMLNAANHSDGAKLALEQLRERLKMQRK